MGWSIWPSHVSCLVSAYYRPQHSGSEFASWLSVSSSSSEDENETHHHHMHDFLSAPSDYQVLLLPCPRLNNLLYMSTMVLHPTKLQKLNFYSTEQLCPDSTVWLWSVRLCVPGREIPEVSTKLLIVPFARKKTFSCTFLMTYTCNRLYFWALLWYTTFSVYLSFPLLLWYDGRKK